MCIPLIFGRTVFVKCLTLVYPFKKFLLKDDHAAKFFETEDYHVLQLNLYNLLNEASRNCSEEGNKKLSQSAIDVYDANARVCVHVYTIQMCDAVVLSESSSGPQCYKPSWIEERTEEGSTCNSDVHDAHITYIFVKNADEIMDRYGSNELIPTSVIYNLFRNMFRTLEVCGLKDRVRSIVLHVNDYLTGPLLNFRSGNVTNEFNFFFHNFDPHIDGIKEVMSRNGSISKCLHSLVSGSVLLTLRKYETELRDCIPESNGSYWMPYLDTTKFGRDLSKVTLRKVAPRYFDCARYFPEISSLLEPENLSILRRDVESLRHWIDWPEKTHYNGDGGEIWKVFPFCHTFPSNDPTATKFIQSTCAVCPRSANLVRSLGPRLRTALFSRLGPRTCLGTHTGWEDLANHVLRVHIPIVVPDGDLCGTWVEGKVQLHKEGQPLVFDDSKIHRAFNYSEEERFVLIVDMERPIDEGIPEGTAVGGHTEELDTFIKRVS